MLRAVIIDDELAAIKTLSLLLQKHVSNIDVIGATIKTKQGIDIIEREKPEIVFLDISMPELDGFSLLQKLTYRDFQLIFTTAHEQYAIRAIKHHAAAYLVKPIDIDELKEAVTVLNPVNYSQNDTSPANKLQSDRRIGLPVREGLIYYTVSDIVWIESSGNYCVFHTADAHKYIVSKNIGEYENALPADLFFRIHKSYLVNMRKVKKLIRSNGYYLEMEDKSILEISRRKKDEFLRWMNEF